MDSLIAAAAQALALGDALGALNYIALRDDPPALALRGIAMAQLDDFGRARALLKRAARGFGPREAVARARCVVAEAEIALVSRDLGWASKRLESAEKVLEHHGDLANAAHAKYLSIRRWLLIGRLDEAERLIEDFDPAPLPSASRAAYQLTVAGIAIRRLRIEAARNGLMQARSLARETGIVSLVAEVESALRSLDAPAARLIANGEERLIRVGDIESLLASETLVIDAGRHAVCCSGKVVALHKRPVLFALARVLAEAWPGAASRSLLLVRAFRAKSADESHRARLRVEIGRLRKAIGGVADIAATSAGFALAPCSAREVALIAPTTEDAHAGVLALLADGESWSSSALALALGVSQRTVQRALDDLDAADKAQAIGLGRARRWMAPSALGFPTTLLLPATPPSG
jgi:hypothetical protein